MFKCDKCGLCCQHLHGSELYRDLDCGTGVCKFLNLSTNLCTIYDNRPLLCRVDASYEAFFKEKMDRKTYYALNKYACMRLKKNAKQ